MTFCPSLQLILGGRVGWKCESFHTYWPKSPLIRRCVKREQDIWNLKQLWERWWSTDVLPKFDVVRSTRHWLIGAPLKRAKKICSVINNSVKNYWSLLKVGTSMHCGSQRQTRPVIKPRMNVGTGGLKWQCSANCHLLRPPYVCRWLILAPYLLLPDL